MKGLTRIAPWSALAGFSIVVVALLLPAAALAAAAVSPQTLMGKLQWRSVGPYIGGHVVAVDGVANQPDLFYMGAVDGGVWKSTNYGVSWKNISDGWPSASDSIGALALAPSNPKIIYAGTGESDIRGDMIAGNGVFKSSDAGKTWHYAGLKDTHTTMDLIVDPNNPDVVYAASMGHVFVAGPHRGVFKSSDGGKTFKRVNKQWTLRQRAFYYMAIAVDPKDPDTVYMPQVDALFVSHDDGKTFKKLHTPHGDNHIVWINPNNTNILLEGNDGGATVSVDRGKTWSSVHNQPTGQFYHVNLDDQFPFHLYGAQQDEGSFEGPSATADHKIPLSAWKSVAFGESTVVLPQPGNPSITYGSGYYSIFVKYDMAKEQFQSVSRWPNYKESQPSSALKYRFAWTHPILFSPANPKQLLVGSQYVMTSDDYGHIWKTISLDLTRNDSSTQGPTGGPIEIDASGAEIYPNVSALAGLAVGWQDHLGRLQ